MENILEQISLKGITSVSLILFAVIDILGSIPIIITLRQREGVIHSEKATIVAGLIMIVFLFLGQSILALFGIDFQSFALAGALIIFLIGMEMVLGIHLFQSSPDAKTGSIGTTGLNILRKAFGVILLAIAIKLFKTNLTLDNLMMK